MNTISIQQAVGTALSHRIAADVALPRRQNDLPVELVREIRNLRLSADFRPNRCDSERCE